MYQFGFSVAGLRHGLKLASLGTGLLLFVIGAVAGADWIVLWIRRPSRRAGILLAAVALVAAIQFMATAAGKPAEFGRFALLPDVAMLAAVMAYAARSPVKGILPAALLAITTAAGGYHYSVGFMRDASDVPSRTRWVAAEHLQAILEAKEKGMTRRPVLGVYADPAPYCLPPVDLEGWDIVRLPRNYDAANSPAAADVIVRPKDYPSDTPISWADKQFDVIEKSVDGGR
jgi:hypothetical protein